MNGVRGRNASLPFEPIRPSSDETDAQGQASELAGE